MQKKNLNRYWIIVACSILISVFVFLYFQLNEAKMDPDMYQLLSIEIPGIFLYITIWFLGSAIRNRSKKVSMIIHYVAGAIIIGALIVLITFLCLP